MSEGSKSLATRWSVADIQAAIVRYTRNYNSIPNVSWGFFHGMECDLVQVTDSGLLHEFEIKRSWSDFVADFRKARFHDDVRIARLTYVLPASFTDERLRIFCKNRYATFKRAFDFLFYREDVCEIVMPGESLTCDCPTMFDFEPKYRTETYLTDAMLKTVNTNDAARPFRRKLFVEELAKLYRIGTIRLWHRTEATAKAQGGVIGWNGDEGDVK